MSTRTKINVDLITEYKGKGEVKKAQSDLAALGGEAKKLAGYFGASLGTAAIIGFGKAAVSAFAADDQSAKILARTLGNLGQSFADVPIESFITKLSEVNGIAKKDLRSAFDSLARGTGSVFEAQKLLNLSLDISAGTGKDLSLVSLALTKAYGGNLTALGRLGAGLSKNDLKTKDFVQITKELNHLFSGDASTAANSYQGDINRLSTTWEDFKITIGSGVVDALSSVGSSSGLSNFQHGMDTVAKDVANVEIGLGVIIGKLANAGSAVNNHSFGLLGRLETAIWNSPLLASAKLIFNLGKSKKATEALATSRMDAANAQRSDLISSYASANLAKKVADDTHKADKTKLDLAKKIAAAAALKLKHERESLALKLAGNTTNMENIEIEAALRRGQTQSVTDVLLLQRAIIDGNGSQAEILAEKVLRANGLVMDISGNISSLKGAKNPFADWPPVSKSALADINAVQEALAALVAKPYSIHIKATVDNPFSPTPHSDLPGSAGALGAGGDQGNGAHPNSSIPLMPSDSGGTNYNTQPSNGADRAGGQGTALAVTVVLDGKTIANAVTETLVNNSASGIPSTFSRNQLGSW